MKRKQHIESFLSLWHKRLLSATLEIHDMQEKVRQSKLQLVFLQTISLKGAKSRNCRVCHVIVECFEKIFT